jgi:hypothetical protein
MVLPLIQSLDTRPAIPVGYALDYGGIDFYGRGPSEQFYGKNQRTYVLLANQNPFDSLEWPALHPHPIAALDEGMGFNPQLAGYQGLNISDLFVWDREAPSMISDKADHAHGPQYNGT